VQVVWNSQLIRFGLVGGTAAGLYFIACLFFIQSGFGPFWGSMLAYGLAIFTSYALQRGWTFRGRHRFRDSLPRYLLLQLACALMAAGLAKFLIGQWHLAPATMALATTLAVGSTSYLGSRCWVFPAASRQDQPAGHG
jgi:putative flippase GtrA